MSEKENLTKYRKNNNDLGTPVVHEGRNSKSARLKAAELPSRLPVGMQEFNEWATDIIDLYGTPDNDSIRFALAAMIINLPSDKFLVSKQEVGHMLLKGMSNQVASFVMYEFKEKQKAEQKAHADKEAAAKAEAESAKV